ncbi:MAG: thiamine phosphate synthase [Thermoleophilaceae bacterium]|nr:thiamine phosphate synthase [Thermoleophilaceae bacterium]
MSNDAGQRRRERLRSARLYLVTESRPDVVAAALEGGVDIVQLRDKDASRDELVASGRELRALCERHGALLIVNDHPDVALEVGADGVHVGQDDVGSREARSLVGGELILGLSTHSPEQIEAAGAEPVDYIGVGPVWETATKPGRPAVGLELVGYAAAHARHPFFAIGGIDRGNVERVARAGAGRIAVVRAIRDADDPRAAAAALRAALATPEREAGRA